MEEKHYPNVTKKGDFSKHYDSGGADLQRIATYVFEEKSKIKEINIYGYISYTNTIDPDKGEKKVTKRVDITPNKGQYQNLAAVVDNAGFPETLLWPRADGHKKNDSSVTGSAGALETLLRLRADDHKKNDSSVTRQDKNHLLYPETELNPTIRLSLASQDSQALERLKKFLYTVSTEFSLIPPNVQTDIITDIQTEIPLTERDWMKEPFEFDGVVYYPDGEQEQLEMDEDEKETGADLKQRFEVLKKFLSASPMSKALQTQTITGLEAIMELREKETRYSSDDEDMPDKWQTAVTQSRNSTYSGQGK